ncbi:hypothetical protein L6274_04225 [Candidatus Parcubacteria bacterium]|nr:hypothetical protein [Candidatus Parcubacteria bacterium]MCG2809701.1 hypothetical protein [Candidatus Portnoybacteria bacterium]
MVIKIRKRNCPNQYRYKSAKQVLTQKDIIFAEKQELELKKALKKTEDKLIKDGSLSIDGRKKNPLKVWYAIGITLNNYLNKYKVDKEDESYFWRDLYERDMLLHKSLHKKNIGETRNDYKIATFLSSKYSLKDLTAIGSWALVREVFSYRSITQDMRLVDWVIKELINNSRSRNDARPFLKNIANRFKSIKTSILTDKELIIKSKQAN